MKKFFVKHGWFVALLVLVLCIAYFLDAQRNKGIATTGSNPESAETASQDSLNYDSFEIISEDSLIYTVLPEVFNDPSFELGEAEAPTEFPVFSDKHVHNASITATPTEFTEYFKKNFGKYNSDQVIITAVQSHEAGKLRWYMRVHEKKDDSVE